MFACLVYKPNRLWADGNIGSQEWGGGIEHMYCLLTFAQCSELSVSAKVIWTVRLCIDLFMCACLFARLLKSDSKCVRAAQYEYLPCMLVCVCVMIQ